MIYSVYDYYEHISRPGSTFEELPLYWLVFNVAVIGTLILLVIGFKKALERIFGIKNLIWEVAALGLWLVLYIHALGPLLNQVFWPFDQLYFSFNFGPISIILMAYFSLRLVLNLLLRKKALYSQ